MAAAFAKDKCAYYAGCEAQNVASAGQLTLILAMVKIKLGGKSVQHFITFCVLGLGLV